MDKARKRLAVFASGSGTTLQAIIDAIDSGVLDAKIAVVVSDQESARALIRAERAGIKTYVIHSKEKKDIDKELFDILPLYCVDLVVLAGYLKMIGPKVLEKYKVINTHPSLLPDYGGKGMHGMHVHQAVVDNKERISGVTVHWVDSEYDHGEPIWQTIVPVYPTDTADDLSERVQRTEKAQLISVLVDFSKGKIE